MVPTSDYQLLWLSRLDTLWLARPDPTSFWGTAGLVAEMRAAIGADAFDVQAADAALGRLIAEGDLMAIETTVSEVIVRITPAGQARLARLEGRAS